MVIEGQYMLATGPYAMVTEPLAWSTLLTLPLALWTLPADAERMVRKTIDLSFMCFLPSWLSGGSNRLQTGSRLRSRAPSHEQVGRWNDEHRQKRRGNHSTDHRRGDTLHNLRAGPF